VHPCIPHPPLPRPYARRDLLASASRRVASARSRGVIDPQTAGVAAALLDWQATARRELTSARGDAGSAVGELLRDIDAGMASPVHADGAGFGSPISAVVAPPLTPSFTLRGNLRPATAGSAASGGVAFGGRRLTQAPQPVPRPTAGDALARPATAGTMRSSHAATLLQRYGDGALSGGAGSTAERFLVRRQLDVVAARNAAAVEEAMQEWRRRKAALDAEIEARIAARRRPRSVNLTATMDYGGLVKPALEYGYGDGDGDGKRGGKEDDGEGSDGGKEDDRGSVHSGKWGDEMDAGGAGDRRRSGSRGRGGGSRQRVSSAGSADTGAAERKGDGSSADGDDDRASRSERRGGVEPLQFVALGASLPQPASAGGRHVPPRVPSVPRLRNPVVISRASTPSALLRPTSAAAALMSSTSGRPPLAPAAASAGLASPAGFGSPGLGRSGWFGSTMGPASDTMPLAGAAAAAAALAAASPLPQRPPHKPTPGSTYVAAINHTAVGSAAVLQSALASGHIAIAGAGGGGGDAVWSPGGGGGGSGSGLGITWGASSLSRDELAASAPPPLSALSSLPPLDVLQSVGEVRMRLKVSGYVGGCGCCSSPRPRHVNVHCCVSVQAQGEREMARLRSLAAERGVSVPLETAERALVGPATPAPLRHMTGEVGLRSEERGDWLQLVCADCAHAT